MPSGSAACKKGERKGKPVVPLVKRDGSWAYEMSDEARWKPGVPLAGRTRSCSTGNPNTDIWPTDCSSCTQLPVWLSDSQPAHGYGTGVGQVVVKWLQLSFPRSQMHTISTRDQRWLFPLRKRWAFPISPSCQVHAALTSCGTEKAKESHWRLILISSIGRNLSCELHNNSRRGQ